MKFGTVVYNNEIYNLDYISSEEVMNIYNLMENGKKDSIKSFKDILLSAKLYSVYINKISQEIINDKVNNQLNSMKVSILQINSKFNEKSKNYEKINQELLNTLNNFEEVLKQMTNRYDKEINELILEKTELEFKLFNFFLKREEIKQMELKDKTNIVNKVVVKIKNKVTKNTKIEINELNKQNEENILSFQKEIKQMNKKIENLNVEKKTKIYDVMEVGNKAMTVGTKKRRNIKNIAKFFSYKFNTYKVIMKNIIEPLNQRIDEFKVNELKNVNGKSQEFDLSEFEGKLIEIKNNMRYRILHWITEKNIQKHLLFIKKFGIIS